MVFVHIQDAAVIDIEVEPHAAPLEQHGNWSRTITCNRINDIFKGIVFCIAELVDIIADEQRVVRHIIDSCGRGRCSEAEQSAEHDNEN